MKKKVLAWMLSVFMAITMMPLPAFATATDESETVPQYVATIGEEGYETLDAAFDAAKGGDEVKILTAGTYALNTSGKDITITGVVDGVKFDNIGKKNMGGANVTFNNVTFDYYPNVNYTGLQHSGNLVYNDCTFDGQVFLYGASETFNDCTFNQNSSGAYNVWTYGAKEVDFNNCIFNSAGKSVLIYKENDGAFVANVGVTKCTFNASQTVEGKAAIEMDSSLINGINLTIDSETKAEGFGTGNISGNSLWNNKKGNDDDANNDITVAVNGTEVLAPIVIEGDGTAEDPYTITSKDELFRFAKKVNDGTYTDVNVKLTTDIDLDGVQWTPIGTKEKPFKGTFDGGENTISNLVVEGGINQGFFGYADSATIKNLKIENANVKGTDCVGAVAGQVYSVSTIDNCHVSGSIKIEGQTNVGGIVGKYYTKVKNSSVIGNGVETSYVKGVYTASDFEGDNVGGIMGHCGENNTLSGNTVENITISGTRKVGGIVGIADQNTDVTNCAVENVVIETTATKDYSESKKTSMSIGGLVGQYQAAGSNNDGSVKGSVVEGVEFVIPEGVTCEAGAITGGARGGTDGMLAPTGVANIENNTIGDVTGATVKYLVYVAQIGEKKYDDLHDAMVAAKSGETVLLISDVNLAGTEWEPVSFKGTFDGQGNVISNLTINKPGVSNTGFITSLNGTFKNVTFTNATVTGGENTAVVAGRAGGGAALAENLTVNGTIKVETTHKGYARAAVIVGGWAYGNYKNITVDGTDKAVSYVKHTGGGDGRYVAGIVGHADEVESYVNCTVKNITISGGWLCGGIAGPGPADGLASGCVVENIDMGADYSGGMFGWYYGSGNIEDSSVKDVTFTAGSTNNGAIGGYSNNKDATVSNVTIENVKNEDGTPLLNQVAKIGDTYYDSLAAAIAAAKDGETIILVKNIGENVTVAQQPNVNITIDGDGKTMTGTITVDGKSAAYPTAGVTIKNVNFDASNIADTCIMLGVSGNNNTRYTSNVTVKDCTFKGAEDTMSKVGIKSYTGGDKNLAVINCTATNMHSLLQIKNIEGVEITDCEVTESKNGVSVGVSTGVTVTGTKIDTEGYGIRADGSSEADMTIEGCTVEAKMPVVVRNTTAEYDLKVTSGTYTPTEGGKYGIIFTAGDDGTYEEPTGKVNSNIDENVKTKVYPDADYVAKLNGKRYFDLQSAIDAAVAGDNTIELLADTDKDVTIKQVEGINIVIDGNDKTYTYSGTITIHGNARFDDAETLTFRNIKFKTSEAGHYFIDSNSTASAERYAHNVTVEGCEFVAEDAAVKSAAAMRIRQGFNITVKDTTATGMHSLMQLYGNKGVVVENVEITGGKNGIAVGTSTAVEVSKATIVAEGYGIRADGSGAYDMTVENCTVEAEMPIIVRNTTGDYALKVLSGTYTPTDNGKYGIIFTADDDEDPLAEPTSNFSYNISEDVVTKIFPDTVDLNQQIKALKAALEAAEKANEAAQAALEAQIAELKDALDATKTENAADKAALEAQITELQAALKSAEDKNTAEQEALAGQIEQLQKDIADAKDLADKQKAELTAEIKSLQDALDAAKEANAADKKALEDKISDLEADIEALQSEKTELEDQIADLKAALEKAEADNADAKAELEAQIADLKAALEKADAEDKAALQKEIKTLQDALKAVEEDSAAKQEALAGQIKQLQKDMADAKELTDKQKEELAAEIKSVQDALDAAKEANAAEKKAFEEQISGLEADIEALQAEKTKLEDQIADLQAALKAAEEDTAEVKANLETQITELKAALEKADADDKAALQKEIKALQDALKTAEADSTAKQEALAGQIEQLQKDIADAKTLTDKQKEELSSEITALKAELDAAAAEKQAMQEEIDALKAEIAQLKEIKQLATPTGVKAFNNVATGKNRVSWNAVEGADEYVIYRSTSKDGPYNRMFTTTGTTYTNTNAKAGTLYYYKVKALSDDKKVNNSELSVAVKRTCDLARPAVIAKSTVKKQVKLTWKKVGGAKKYVVYRATSANGKYTKIATTTKISYTNKSLKAGKTYYYKVKAIAKNSAANSAYSVVDKCKVKK